MSTRAYPIAVALERGVVRSPLMVTWIQTLALDIAGLGLLGAGAYALVSGHGGEAASAALLSLGGGYLGYKVAASTTTVVPAPTAVKDTPTAVVVPGTGN